MSERNDRFSSAVKGARSTACARWVASFAVAALLVAGVFAAPASATPITIDDFSTPGSQTAYVISLLNGNPFSQTDTGAGILNNSPTVPIGQRVVSVLVVSTPVGLVDATGTIGAGSYGFSTSLNAAAEATLTYSAAGGGPLGSLDLTSGGTNNAMVLNLDSDFTFGIRVDAFGPSGSVTALFNHIGGASTDSVLFTSFSPVAGTFNFNALDKLIFTFNVGDLNALDFSLDNIAATFVTVPEPATAVLAVIGAAIALTAAVRRRRR